METLALNDSRCPLSVKSSPPLWGPLAGNFPFDCAIELAYTEGPFGKEPFSVSALKASQ